MKDEYQDDLMWLRNRINTLMPTLEAAFLNRGGRDHYAKIIEEWDSIADEFELYVDSLQKTIGLKRLPDYEEKAEDFGDYLVSLARDSEKDKTMEPPDIRPIAGDIINLSMNDSSAHLITLLLLIMRKNNLKGAPHLNIMKSGKCLIQ